MVLHNQYPWDRTQIRLTPVGELRDDDYVVVFHPRNREVLDFIRRVVQDGRAAARRRDSARRFDARSTAKPPIRPYPADRRAGAVRGAAEDRGAGRGQGRAACAPTTTSSATRAYSWSPMTAEEITDKTGIESRVYTARPLEEIALEAAAAALQHAGPRARGDRRGAVLHLHEHTG